MSFSGSAYLKLGHVADPVEVGRLEGKKVELPFHTLEGRLITMLEAFSESPGSSNFQTSLGRGSGAGRTLGQPPLILTDSMCTEALGLARSPPRPPHPRAEAGGLGGRHDRAVRKWIKGTHQKERELELLSLS